MTDLDMMARELLAAELLRGGWAGELSVVILADRPDHVRVAGDVAMAAIRTALLTAPPGYVLVPEVSKTTAALIDLLVKRDQAGRAKYGTTLDRTDLRHGEWLQHMAEELLDGAGYALAAMRTAAPEVK